jgi:soluble lytic murein transglycosylase
MRHFTLAVVLASLAPLASCAAPEARREAGGAPDAAPTPEGPVVEVAPPPPPPPVTPGPDAPPVLDTLTPWFTEPPLSEALAAFQADDREQAVALFDAFAVAHPEDSRALPARFHAAWLQAERDPVDAAQRFHVLALDWPLMGDIARVREAELLPTDAEGHAHALAALDLVEADSAHLGRALVVRTQRLLASRNGEERARDALEAVAKSAPGRLLPESWKALAELRTDPAAAQSARLELAMRFPSDALGREALGQLTPSKLAPAARLELGRALFEAGRYDAMRGVIGTMKSPEAEVCQAWILLGRAAERKKKDDDQALTKAFDFYKKALACEGGSRADATFLGGRARMPSNPKEARKLLQAHVAEFPERSTADDALLLLAESEKRPKAAMKSLLATLRRYPQGDMADAVAWDLVGPHVEARNWKEVEKTTAQVLEIAPEDLPGRHAGRYRYWHARALWELGQQDLARAEWRAVFKDNPLSYYAVLAWSRLGGEDGLVPAADGGGQQVGPPDLRVAAALWRDDHFRRAVEWARLSGSRYDRAPPFLDMIDRELAEVATDARPKGDEWAWTKISVQQLGGGYARSMRTARTLEATGALAFPVGLAALPWKLAYPRPFAGDVVRWAGERALDANWVWSIMRVESNFDPEVTSWANAIGLMQIILPTAKSLARDTDIDPTRENLMRPAVALELGTKYLAKLLGRHKVVPLASAGYNAGGGAVAKWRKQFGDVDVDEFVERIPYREAHLYAKSVTQTLARYRWLYQGEVMALDLAPVGTPDQAAPPTE